MLMKRDAFPRQVGPPEYMQNFQPLRDGRAGFPLSLGKDEREVIREPWPLTTHFEKEKRWMDIRKSP